MVVKSQPQRIRINQNGCERSTLAQFVTLRRLAEGIKAKQLQAVIIFVNFSKAFDSIYREKLMEIPFAYRLPNKIVDAIIILCKDTLIQLITPDDETDLFEVIAGVLQGDTLASFLFIIALYYTLQEATRNISIDFMLEKRQALGNLQYSSLTQISLMILPCFQTIWNKPSFFYRDWKLQTKPLRCISTARRRNIWN